MPIVPLPQFEADLKQLEEEDRKLYEAMKAPKTLVVRFGFMKLVGEFPYDGEIKPGCGSKMVVRTHRGVEMGEMLTSTCPNSGCGKSVSRKQMLEYIENSGGRDYPFFTEGRVLRVATPEDMDRQAKIEQSRHELRVDARRRVEAMGLRCKIVEVEPILGGERLTVHFASEERLDLRELGRQLGMEHRTRIDFKQVGARDEARLTADYEKCGQYCCCKNFLKVLKPISMKSAKVQKATLDPLKISGRCGRLMCCLRYEDQTYEDLRKSLPKKRTRVGTPEGDGTVIDGQILTQLVLVRLDDLDKDGRFRDVAIPVENLEPPKSAVPPPPRVEEPQGGIGPGSGARRDAGPAREQRPARPQGEARPEPGAQERRPERRPMNGPPPARPSAPGPKPQAQQPPKPPMKQQPPARPVDDVPSIDDIDGDDLDDGAPESGPDDRGGGPGGPARGPDGGGGRRRRRRRRRGGPPRGPGGPAGGGPSGPG